MLLFLGGGIGIIGDITCLQTVTYKLFYKDGNKSLAQCHFWLFSILSKRGTNQVYAVVFFSYTKLMYMIYAYSMYFYI